MENIDKLRYAILIDSVSEIKYWTKELYCPTLIKDKKTGELKRKKTIEICKYNLNFEINFVRSELFVLLMEGKDIREDIINKYINYLYFFYYKKIKKLADPYYSKMNIKEKIYELNQ